MIGNLKDFLYTYGCRETNISKPLAICAQHNAKSTINGYDNKLYPCPLGLDTQLSSRVYDLTAHDLCPIGFDTINRLRRLLDPCPIRFGAQPSLRTMDLQFIRLMPNYAWHVAKAKGIGFDSSLNSYPLRLDTVPSLRAMSPPAYQIHICLVSEHSGVQRYWVGSLSNPCLIGLVMM